MRHIVPILPGYTAYTGTIEVKRNGGTILTTTPYGGAQFGTLRVRGVPWFMLCCDRGVAAGHLEIHASEFDVDYDGPAPIRRGDWVHFIPEPGVEWARLMVTQVVRETLGYVCSLEGESNALLGRPAVDGAAVYPDPFVRDADGEFGVPFQGLEDWTPGDLVNWLFEPPNPLAYFSDSEWWDNRRIDFGGDILGDDYSVPAYKLSAGDTCCADVFRDMAALRQGESDVPVVWGIDNGDDGYTTGPRHAFFEPRPDRIMMEYHRNTGMTSWAGRSGTHVNILNDPSVSDGDVYYNAVEVSYKDGKVTFMDSDAIDAMGGFVKRAKEEVPTIATPEMAESYARAFLWKYAYPQWTYEPVRFTLCDAGNIPVPWGGWCKIRSNGADDGALLSIRSVKIEFGEAPVAEMTIGETEPPKGHPFSGGNGNSCSPGTPFHAAMQNVRRVGNRSAAGVMKDHSHQGIGDGGIIPTWYGPA